MKNDINQCDYYHCPSCYWCVRLLVLHNTTSYVTTDNAKVDGDQIKISSPASGQIKSLNVKQGDKLDKGDKVAEVLAQGQDGQSKDMNIKMPQKVRLLKQMVSKVL